MTLQELKTQRANILGPELAGEDLMSLEEGMVLFGGTVANGKRQKNERVVATSGFRYVAHVSHTLGTIDCLGLTKSGYASIYSYNKASLDENHFLFRVGTPGPDYKSLLRSAILVMMRAGLIDIQSATQRKVEYTAEVSAPSVFFDESLIAAISQSDWNNGPMVAVAECITSALEAGELKFKHYNECGKEIPIL